MLRYFKKYVWAAYALSVLIPAASLAAFSLVMGGNVVKTLPGLFSSLMLFFACLYVMPRLMGQLADRKAEQLVSPSGSRTRRRARGSCRSTRWRLPMAARSRRRRASARACARAPRRRRMSASVRRCS